MDAIIETLGLRERVIEIPEASDMEIRNLLSCLSSRHLLKASGYRPWKRLWHGLPVVCSDIPVAREVYGDVVRYANPWDPADFARAIRMTLREPENAERREAGRKWALQYSREVGIRNYISLFRCCIQEG